MINNTGFRQTVIGRICLLSCVVGLLTLSVSLAKYAASGSIGSKHGVTLFLNPQNQSDLSAQRRSRVTEISKQLEFMVWKRERRALLTEQSELLHAEINANPFNFASWRELTFIYKYANAPATEKIWALRQATSLQKWYELDRYALTHHCVVEYSTFQQFEDRLCSELIRALPLTLHRASLARRMGVTEALLESVLEQEGLSIQEQP